MSLLISQEIKCYRKIKFLQIVPYLFFYLELPLAGWNTAGALMGHAGLGFSLHYTIINRSDCNTLPGFKKHQKIKNISVTGQLNIHGEDH